MSDEQKPLPAIVLRADRHYTGEGLADAVRAYVDAAVAAERARCAQIVQENAYASNGVMRITLQSNADAIRQAPAGEKT